MFRYKVTLLAILVVLSLFGQNVDAHIINPSMDPRASVDILENNGSEVKTLRASASCSFSIGANSAENFHLHYANWFGQVYIHAPGGVSNPG